MFSNEVFLSEANRCTLDAPQISGWMWEPLAFAIHIDKISKSFGFVFCLPVLFMLVVSSNFFSLLTWDFAGADVFFGPCLFSSVILYVCAYHTNTQVQNDRCSVWGTWNKKNGISMREQNLSNLSELFTASILLCRFRTKVAIWCLVLGSQIFCTPYTCSKNMDCLLTCSFLVSIFSGLCGLVVLIAICWPAVASFGMQAGWWKPSDTFSPLVIRVPTALVETIQKLWAQTRFALRIRWIWCSNTNTKEFGKKNTQEMHSLHTTAR